MSNKSNLQNEAYKQFIASKQKAVIDSGFEVTESYISSNYPSLFDFQNYTVRKALKKGRYAIFAECGLGKTFQQIVWANEVVKHTKKPVLILAPLCVSEQTIQEGVKFGISIKAYEENTVLNGIYITNYEQLKNVDTDKFIGVVLDESSILKNFEGKTKEAIFDAFEKTPYKLACTATPSPNDPMELANHAEFLGVMKRAEMLAMYFVHDGGETSKWRLKGHAVSVFYKDICNWATMISTPSDIGFDDTKYVLPKLNYFNYEIKTPQKNNQKLFNDASVNATNFNAELRATMQERMENVAEIVNANPNENFIIWIKQNEEGELLKKLIPNSIEVKGSDKDSYKREKLLGFANNEFKVLITKTKIASFGMNYQNCHNQIFASLDFSFEALYQGIRRSYRFGQKNEVNIHLITTDTMQNVVKSINQKNKQFELMKQEMQKAMNVETNNEKNNTTDNPKIVKTENYQIMHGDCVELIQTLPNESVGFSVFSPPFASLYTYSNDIRDMGNSGSYEEFCNHFDFLVKELHRVLMQGRNVAVHCMDLPIQKGKEGFIGLRDFSGMILRAFEQAGFIYHSRVTIWKNPVTEMQRTKALGLLHKQVKKDSTMTRVGIPDYVLIFRKDGERNEPVKCDIPVDIWQKYASPVWMDIDYGDTLQYTNARDKSDERHICPLQLPTIERLITLYTNEGDTVLTPFMGIGSEAYKALEMNRKAIGFELKESYFKQAVSNVKDIVVRKKTIQSLF